MIHQQPRRDVADDAAATTTEPTAIVPAQPAGPSGRRRDAYDLYAQIYAIRGDGASS